MRCGGRCCLRSSRSRRYTKAKLNSLEIDVVVVGDGDGDGHSPLPMTRHQIVAVADNVNVLTIGHILLMEFAHLRARSRSAGEQIVFSWRRHSRGGVHSQMCW